MQPTLRWGTLFLKIEYAEAPGIVPDDSRGAVNKQGDMFDIQSQYPVSAEASGIVLGEEVGWLRLLKSAKGRTKQADAGRMIDAGKRLQELVGKGNEVVLPVLARYGTDRLWKQAASKDKATPNRMRGYEGALRASANEARMNAWFKSQSIWEWQNRRERVPYSLRLRMRSRPALMPPRQPRAPWSTMTPSLTNLFRWVSFA